MDAAKCFSSGLPTAHLGPLQSQTTHSKLPAAFLLFAWNSHSHYPKASVQSITIDNTHTNKYIQLTNQSNQMNSIIWRHQWIDRLIPFHSIPFNHTFQSNLFLSSAPIVSCVATYFLFWFSFLYFKFQNSYFIFHISFFVFCFCCYKQIEFHLISILFHFIFISFILYSFISLNCMNWLHCLTIGKERSE